MPKNKKIAEHPQDAPHMSALTDGPAAGTGERNAERVACAAIIEGAGHGGPIAGGGDAAVTVGTAVDGRVGVVGVGDPGGGAVVCKAYNRSCSSNSLAATL